MSVPNDALDDASSEELRAIIEVDRQRLGFYADVLLSLGFDPLELLEAVA